MRPKTWAMFNSETSHWKTLEEFEAAMKQSKTFRANALVEEHLEYMDKEDRRLLYVRLKNEFEPKEALTAR